MSQSHTSVFPIRPMLADDWVTESYIVASLSSFMVAIPFIVLGLKMMKRAQAHDQEHRHSRAIGLPSSEKRRVETASIGG